MALDPERHKKIFGQDFLYPKRKEDLWSVRVNTIKISAEELKKKLENQGFILEQIPWIKEGFWIETEKNLSKDPFHVLGYYFLQDASSMIPPLALDPHPGETILDLAASPGGKTTQISASMENTGAIIANDINHKRLKALRGNLQRCGAMNAVVTRSFGENFYKYGVKFSKILLDLPCSGTGTLSLRILQQTNVQGISFLSHLQKKILFSASKTLEAGGTIIYSTCSLEPEENEENIDYAVKELGLKVEKINLQHVQSIDALTEWNNKKFDKSVSKSTKIPPSDKQEGFFICKLTN